jgi:hypothetical protein
MVMSEGDRQPGDSDAVLGNLILPPRGGLVLGGMERIKRQAASLEVDQQMTALLDALNYGDAGLAFLVQSLSHEAAQIRRAAHQILWQNPGLPCLKALLAAQNWKLADEMTSLIILKLAHRQSIGSLTIEDIGKFPCADLLDLDHLWMVQSNGRFGFSVQGVIWQRLGGKPNSDWRMWCRFGQQVGWLTRGSWLWWNELNFSLTAPAGHLPGGSVYMGWGLGDFWIGCRALSALTSRMTACLLK